MICINRVYMLLFILLTTSTYGTTIGPVSLMNIYNESPHDCKDILQQGNKFEGYYLVYPNASEPTLVDIVYCFEDDGFQILSIDIENQKSVTNCLEHQELGMSASGPSIIYPYPEHPNDPVIVNCDYITAGGGWTVIQKRYDGTESFYRSWDDYVAGFGNPTAEHYLGNDVIAALTQQTVTELRIELEDWDNERVYAHYQMFYVDNQNKYRMYAFQYDGTAGDTFVDNVGQPFSTFDEDYDAWSLGNCSVNYHGAWWYGSCDAYSNLNGRYYPAGETHGNTDGIFWSDFHGREYSLRKTSMMLRPFTRKGAANKNVLFKDNCLTDGFGVNTT